MTRFPRPSGLIALSLIALAIVAFPTHALAGSLGFQNDTAGAVMVQGSTVDAQGRPHFGQPHKLNPTEKASEKSAPGVKNIVIYDPANPKIIYYSGAVNVGARDDVYSIHVDPVTKTVNISLVPPAGAVMPKK